MKLRHTIEILPIDSLTQDKRNPRRRSKAQVAKIGKSIRRYGFNSPIIIDKNDQIVAGHGRWEAAKALGLTEVPCIRLDDLSPQDLRAYLIADNKLALDSEWDFELLADELQQLIDGGYEFELSGFEMHEIDAILVDANEASPIPRASKDDDCPDRPWVAVTRLGDVWICGPHRLICGDAKDPNVVTNVMAGVMAAMCITDLPFNVRIDGNVCGNGRIKHREFAEASGEMSSGEFTGFLTASFEAIEGVCRNGAIIYTFMDWRHLTEILAAGKAVFTELKNLCVWNKTNAGMGTFYRSQHELVLVWKVGDAPHTNNFGLGDKGRHRSNIWVYAGVNSFGADRMAELESHPTVKPVALIADAIRDVSDRGDIVLDTFGGSGTTMIAAHKVGRKARLVEIDPGYCDVAVKRWQKLTGKQAVLEATGQTFEEVSAERFAETPAPGEAA